MCGISAGISSGRERRPDQYSVLPAVNVIESPSQTTLIVKLVGSETNNKTCLELSLPKEEWQQIAAQHLPSPDVLKLYLPPERIFLTF